MPAIERHDEIPVLKYLTMTFKTNSIICITSSIDLQNWVIVWNDEKKKNTSKSCVNEVLCKNDFHKELPKWASRTRNNGWFLQSSVRLFTLHYIQVLFTLYLQRYFYSGEMIWWKAKARWQERFSTTGHKKGFFSNSNPYTSKRDTHHAVL